MTSVQKRPFEVIYMDICGSLKETVNMGKYILAELLPEVEFTLYATEQKTIGKSPAEVVYGFKINRIQWFQNDKRKIRENIIDELVTKQSQRLRGMGSIREFKVGDKVLVKLENRTKDDGRYEGPYTVIEILHERSYRLKDEKGNSIKRMQNG